MRWSVVLNNFKSQPVTFILQLHDLVLMLINLSFSFCGYAIMYLFYHVVWSFLGNAGLCEVIPFIIIMTIILCWAGGAGHCRNNTRGSITILHCARIKYKSKLMSLGCNLTTKTIWIACCLLGSMFTWRIYRLFQAESPLLRGSLYISQINHLLLHLYFGY